MIWKFFECLEGWGKGSSIQNFFYMVFTGINRTKYKFLLKLYRNPYIGVNITYGKHTCLQCDMLIYLFLLCGRSLQCFGSVSEYEVTGEVTLFGGKAYYKHMTKCYTNWFVIKFIIECFKDLTTWSSYGNVLPASISVTASQQSYSKTSEYNEV